MCSVFKTRNYFLILHFVCKSIMVNKLLRKEKVVVCLGSCTAYM